ncbi:hypothetical protein J3R30DRAFT_2883168 [Lentinula aciculospora]|uniref:Uncharacterized protein n=1 Tax=Lentinula aciculospora TaxID=153920 RepID=A0A9W9AD97_9AGAR|nr:hypothetical protein J3R30DRAFT_2883168 [Lentinula aciculospora]
MELPPLTANSPPETTGLTRLLLDLGDYDSELDNTLPELRLARYAHTSTRPVKPSKPKIIPSHTTRAMSTSVGASRSTPAKKAVEQNIVQRLSDEFPTISCLLICVSCDTTWTTRKSVPQKLTHIKSCAKKHGIKDDTLVELVRKGIENALAMQPKGKHIATDEPARKTFFDEVVHDAAPRKRNRRQEVTSTIKDIGETRNTIMRKARMIVSKGNSNVRAFRERGIGDLDSDGDLYTDFLPSSTPRFGKSSLARRTGLQARSLFHDDGEDPESLLSFFNAPLLPYIPSIREPPSMPSIPSSSGLGNEVPQVLMDIDVHNLETPPKNKTAVCPFICFA